MTYLISKILHRIEPRVLVYIYIYTHIHTSLTILSAGKYPAQMGTATLELQECNPQDMHTDVFNAMFRSEIICISRPTCLSSLRITPGYIMHIKYI